MRAVISNFESLRGGIEKLASEGNGVPLDSLTLTAPVPDPSKIVAAPVNYLDHMTEMNQASHIDSLGVFLKAPSSLIGHRGTVRLPYSDRRFDQEGELCFVISRQARNVKADNAFDYIFGFSIALDITMRGGEDRSTRKSFDTFTPMGPWILTSDEINSLADLQLRCWVNDELRQQAKISQLIWGVPELLEYVSSVMTLLPGDIISTGTPAGVGPIDSGDVIVAEVSEIGRLKVHVSDQGATLSVTKGAATGALGLQGMKQS
jgi:2-keto-4-pentenoate hydratase/2-oxohepta-3-ene-1,7-dioic acid hydratase in catechol pathway